MGISAMKERISDKLARANGSNKYYAILLVSAALYSFFFATSAIFPYNGKLYETPAGTVGKLTDYTTLTLKRWEYDSEQKAMEIELALDDGYNNYRSVLTPSAMTRSLTQLPVQITAQDRELLVVHIFGVPSRFEAVALTMTADTGERPVKFYCDFRSVRSANLTTKSLPEYWRQSLENDVAAIQNQIAESKKDNQNTMEYIELLQSDIRVLEHERSKQTTAGQQNTDQYIRQKKLAIESQLSSIKKQQDLQESLTELLNHTQERLKKVGNP